MAAPQNTYSTYDQVGIREDLEDTIYNIDPHETPITSAMAKIKANNVLHEWQTDALRSSSTSNAHVEGDDTVATARTPTTRLGNYCQILKEAAVVSGTDAGVKKAGRGKEMAYQLVKAMKEIKLDLEATVANNQARSAGSESVARQMAGMPAWLTSNIYNNTDGTDPTGDGSDARVDGTQSAFTQADLNSCLQSIWENGGKPDCVYLSAYQVGVSTTFTGMNNQRSTIGASVGGTNAIVDAVDVYVTNFGTVKLIPTRENRGRDIFVVQKDMWALANLRGVKNESLAKTGDSEKRQIVMETTLVCKNEKASGMLVDCSTS